ncbi:hypothetical protein JCM11641_005462 [Rhodosporidiobolus odoratus]
MEADDSPESWDLDPAFSTLPPGPLLLPSFSLEIDCASNSSSTNSSRGSSPTRSHCDEVEREGDEEGGSFFDELDGRLRLREHKLHEEGEAEDWDEPGEGEGQGNESSIDSSRTSTTTGTLKDLMGGLSLSPSRDDSPLSLIPPSPSTSTSTSTSISASARASNVKDAHPRPDKKSQILRGSSSLSQLLATSLSPSARGRGKVTHLGSTPFGAAQEVGEGDWDQDLEGLEGLGLPVLEGDERQVAKKGSFASHLSLELDTEDEAGEREEKGVRKKISIASFSDVGDDFEADDDFDLPTTQSTLSLAPQLALNSRASLASLRSFNSTSSASSSAPNTSPVPTAATLAPQLPTTPRTPTPSTSTSNAPSVNVNLTAPSLVTSPAPAPSPSPPGLLIPADSDLYEGDATERESESEEDEDEENEQDDSTFFEDLVLPSYFGVPSSSSPPPLTPPTSEGESDLPSSSSPTKENKVDLQQLLRQKLEQRGGRGLLFHSSSSSSAIPTTAATSSTCCPPLATLSSATTMMPPSPEVLQEQARLTKHREPSPDQHDHSHGHKSTNPSLPEAEAGEEGHDLSHPQGDDPHSWNPHQMRERMRTISGARAREAEREQAARVALRGRAGAGGGRGGMAGRAAFGAVRKTLSDGKGVPLPSSGLGLVGTGAMGRRANLPPPSRSSTPGGATIGPSFTSSLSRLARPASAQGGERLALDRPPSSASTHSTSGMKRPGPPPAPSAASRDRVRMRTMSLRTVGSSSDLRSTGGATARGVKVGGRGGGGGKLDVPAPAPTSSTAGARKPSLSPVPATTGGTSSAPTSTIRPSPSPASASSVSKPTLRPKRSQQHLSAGFPSSSSSSSSSSSATRPLDRKRSLQNLSSLPTPTPTASSISTTLSTSTTMSTPLRPSSRQTDPHLNSHSRRSPSPAQSSSSSPFFHDVPRSFAAPTASSTSRIRERVQSNPSLPLTVPPQTPQTPSSSSASGAFTLPPSSAAGVGASKDRLLRPTLASASKSRPSCSSTSRPTSPLKPGLVHARSLLIPLSLSSAPRHSVSASASAARGRIPLPPPGLSSHPLNQNLVGAASKAKASQKKRDAEYGDGTELDAFDDLPVSKEREKERVVSVGGGSRKSSGASTATVTTGTGGSWERKSGTAQGMGMGSRVPVATALAGGQKRRVGGGGDGKGRKESEQAVKRAAVEKEKERGKEDPKGKIIERTYKAKDKEGKRKVEAEGKGKKKRREPHLIRHLGGERGVKVQGEMTYNPHLHRWEGNESILREFDKALSTSTRPALISPFSSSMGSPARTNCPVAVKASDENSTSNSNPGSGKTTNATTSSSSNEQPQKRKVVLPAGAAPGVSRAAAKVVGDMVFDPTTCSWHALAGPDAEDELDLDWGGMASAGSGGEAGHDEFDAIGRGGEGERDGAWESGERERMLRGRASFVLEEGGSSEEDFEVEEGEGEKKGRQTKRRLAREGRDAVERVRVEMSGWMVKREDAGEEDRGWLWDLRGLIMDTH